MTVAIQRTIDIGITELLKRGQVADLPKAEQIMRECLHRSVEVRYGLVNGEIACVWGLIPPSLLSTGAYLWLLTTEIVAENKFLFVRHSQRYVEEALKTYPLLYGDVIIGNRSGKKWLEWLGARFGEPCQGRIPFTIMRRPRLG
jgi:hypothetical protein